MVRAGDYGQEFVPYDAGPPEIQSSGKGIEGPEVF